MSLIKISSHIRCYLLDHPDLSEDDRRRLIAAASILETGSVPGAFTIVDAVSLRVVQDQYVDFVVQHRETLNEAAAVLKVHPSSIWKWKKKPRMNGNKPISRRSRTRIPPKTLSRKI